MVALTRAGLVLGATALVTATAAAPVPASTPGSSTLTAPKKTGSTFSTWSGTLAEPGLVVVVPTDTHELEITVPGKAKKYLKKRDAAVVVEMSWEGTPLDDLDLYVLDEAGEEVASSIAGPGVEVVMIPVTGSVTYTVQVEGFTSTPGISYDARATLTATRKVR